MYSKLNVECERVEEVRPVHTGVRDVMKVMVQLVVCLCANIHSSRSHL